jgi:predicted permease
MPNDAVYAVRQLRKAPGFAITAILTLALGIGANTAIYRVFDAVFFRPLPVRDPERLVRVQLLENGQPRNFSYPEYRDFAARPHAAEGLLATSDYPLQAAILRGRGQARPVRVVIVSPEYFRVLGVEASKGRVFDTADDRSPVAVVSEAFRQREFADGGDPLGQTLRINKSAVQVVGVAQPFFHGEKPGSMPDLWVPMGLTPQLLASDWLSAPRYWLTVMARLRRDVPERDARQAFAAAYRQSGHPSGDVRLEPAARGAGNLAERYGSPAALLMAGVGVLLLIACSNLATLLLGRGAARSHEVSVRLALGAGRGRIVRQLLTECVAISCAGGALGLAASVWGSRALGSIANIPLDWNWRVLAFTAAATILSGLLFGLTPALASTRTERLRPGRRVFGGALIAAQVAMSLLLLSGAGMLARSLWNLRHQDFGFQPERLVCAALPWEFSPAMMARYKALQEPLLERLRAIRGVEEAALSGFGPFGSDQHTGPLSATGTPSVGMRIVHVSAGYFETTGIPIVAGRPLAGADRAGAPAVVVLSETAARQLFGGAAAVGRFVSPASSYDSKNTMEVVGVAHDVRFANPTEAFQPLMFVPLSQSPSPITSALVRAEGDPAPLAAQVRAAIRAADPDLAVASVRPAPEIVDSMLGQQRQLSLLSSAFGLTALVLASIGVYGVVSYAVERRVREIGIRVALGAQRRQVTGMLIRDVAKVVTAGVILGSAGGVTSARAMQSMLFGLDPNDYSLLFGAAVLLLTVAGIAAYLPARRAARLDPLHALRID